MKRYLRLALLPVLMGVTPAPAQTVEPVIVVNEKAITAYELEQRALLLQAFGAPGDTTELAREQLIDDRLRMWVVERFELELSTEELDAGLANFAQQRDLEVEQVLTALRQRGIDESTLLDFLEAGLSWRNLVQARFTARARPTEQDLDTALDFANRSTDEQVLLQEIAISTEEFGPERAQELATELSRSLNRGGNFNAAVGRYSRAPSRANGGRLDWVSARQLPPQVALQVLALTPGEVTAAIPLGGGISIFKLRDIREVPRTVEASAEDTVTYYELVQPLSASASPQARATARALAEEIQRETRLCRDLDGRAAEFDPSSGRSAPTPIGALPPGLAGQIAALEPGDIEIVEDGRGVVLLMLCARSGETSPEEREALRTRLFNQRMSSFSQGFLQELRADAVIIEK